MVISAPTSMDVRLAIDNPGPTCTNMAPMARTKLYWAELADRLRVLRASRGWTAEFVAERAGLGSKATVLAAESGDRKPSNATIYKLEQAYGLAEGGLINLVTYGPDRAASEDALLAKYGPEWLRRNKPEALRMLME